jgi:hypothetical protein
MDADKLRQLVSKHGITDTARLERVLQRIDNGATIGCRGKFRTATSCKNAPDALENGPQVTDAIATWINKGLAYGPVDEEDVPADAKINGILTKQKPDGTVRIILNLSAPKGLSVNEGIDSDEFPATMSSTEAWIAVLNRAGRGCWFSKTDWADAYKHVTVSREDTALQWFEWGGKYFKELCLIFGSASSAGIFDDVAKTVLDLVCRISGFPPSMICQHLDDICGAAAEKQKLLKFDETFNKVAEATGVRLAPKDNPDKAFGPSQQGVVFGVHYDTEAWCWSIPPTKMFRLLRAIQRALDGQDIGEKDMKSLAGKIINIKPLFPTGRFNVDKIMKALATSNLQARVQLDAQCKRQLHFWHLIITACQGQLTIPVPFREPAPWAKQVFTDAAGGTLENIGRGVGGICGPRWFYYPWSKAINSGAHRVGEKKVGRKLSALELLGPLVGIVVMADKCYRQPVTFWVDNAGSVGAWKKGYSASCPLVTSIVKAISTVAAGIGADMHIAKITRCTGTGATIADHLSKANFVAARQLSREAEWPLELDPCAIPAVLLQWLEKPVPDDNLGHRLLKHLGGMLPILGYSDKINAVHQF